MADIEQRPGQSHSQIISLGPWDREADDLDATATWGPTSAGALEHLRFLIVHRPDYDELTVVLHPARCSLCEELAVAYLGRVEGSRS